MTTINLMRAGLTSNDSPQSTPDTRAGRLRERDTSLPHYADSEAARTNGDARLAGEYAKQLQAGSRLSIPPASTLGGWIEVLKHAMDFPALERLLKFTERGMADIEVDPVKGEVRFRYLSNGASGVVPLTDMPGGKDIFDSLMAAANALAPNGVLKIPAYFKGGTVAMIDVQLFYAEPTDLTPTQKNARSKELASHPLFKGQGALPPEDMRQDVLRMLGNSKTFLNMLDVLKKQVENPCAGLDLDTIEVEVAPGSELWSADKNQPVKMSLRLMIIHHGLLVPGSLDELANLERVLSTPPLQAPSEGNFGGLLSKDVPLDEGNQKKITGATAAWKALQTQVPADAQGRTPTLFDYLERAVPEPDRRLADKDPQAFFKAMINTPQARALGQQLQEAIGALPTQTSAQEALLAALALEADPAAGQQRNSLAGYDLRQQDNWMRSPAEIVQRFEQHLQRRFGPKMAKVVAYQLLAISAPEFLVKELPVSLVYGSQQWASFAAAVLRREQDTQGSTAGQSYQRIMEHDALAPVTEAGQSQSQFAAMRSVIDWGIANKVIEQSNDDTYSAEVIDRAAVALQKQVAGLVEAAQALTTPAQTREELALVELRRVYGVQNESFFTQELFTAPGERGRKYSLLHIYMSGHQHSPLWRSSCRHFTTAVFRAGVSQLPDINARFDQRFEQYADGLKNALAVQFQYQLSQLPVEDRLLIERSKVTVFKLGLPLYFRGPTDSSHPMFNYEKNGAVIIRAELDGRVRHYLYSPSQGQIIKSVNEDEPGLTGPKSDVSFSMARAGHPGEKEPPVTIRWQTRDMAWTKKDAVDFLAHARKLPNSLTTALPGSHSIPRADVPSTRVNELSRAVADSLAGKLDGLKTGFRGETKQEREDRQGKAVKKYLLGLVPFHDAIKSFINGKPLEGLFYAVLDFVGLVVPGVKGGQQAIKAGAKGLAANLGFLKGFAKAGLKAANPLAGVYDLGRGVFKLGKSGVNTVRSLSQTPFSAFDKVRFGRGRSASYNVFSAGNKGVVAEGVYRPLGASADAVPAQAVLRKGQWYAYDRKAGVPYGAPLNRFKPNAGTEWLKPVAAAAVDRAFDAGMDLGVDLAFQKIRRQVTLRQFQFPQTERVPPNTSAGLADQVLAADVQALVLEVLRADVSLAALEGGEPRDPCLAPDDGSTGLRGRLEQIEDALNSLEDRVGTGAQALRVYFKPYIPLPVDPQSENAMRDRLNAVKQRLAVVNKALSKLKEVVGEHTK